MNKKIRQYIVSWLFGLMTLFCLVPFQSVQAQKDEIKVTMKVENESLLEVVQDLTQKYQIAFAYDTDLLEDIYITVSLKAVPLVQALNLMLENTELGFIMVDDNAVIIKPKSEIKNGEGTVTETVNLSGKVVDIKTMETLPYASVYVEKTRRGTSTNPEGFFNLLNVPSDTSTIVVQYVGYNKKYIKLDSINTAKPLLIKVGRGTKDLNEIVVWDEYTPQMVNVSSYAGGYAVDPTTFQALPSMGQTDILRSMKLFPGINATNDTSGGLVVRGMGVDKTLMLLDGITLYHLDHFFGLFSAFNADAVKKLHLYKGAFQAKYGGRVAGVIDITLKDGNQQEIDGMLNIDVLSSSFLVSGPIVGDKLMFMVAARVSAVDFLSERVYQELFESVVQVNKSINRIGFDGEPFFPAYGYYDANFKLTYNLSDKDEFIASYYGGEDNLSFNESQTVVRDATYFNYRLFQKQSWGSQGVNIRWNRKWNPYYYTQLLYSASRYHSILDDEQVLSSIDRATLQAGTLFETSIEQLNEVNDLTLRCRNELKLSNKHNLVFGVDMTHYHVILEYDLVSDLLNEFNERRDYFSVYLQDTYVPSEKWKINAGLRFNRFSAFDQNYWEPRINISYQAIPKIKLKLGGGIYNQYISRVLRHTIYSGNPDFWIIAGNRLPAVEGHDILAGVTYEDETWLFDAEVYVKQLDGHVDYLPRVFNYSPNLPTIPFGDENFYVIGSQFSKGLDVFLQKKIGKYTGWISYTLSEILDKFEETNNGEPFPAENDQRHQLSIVNTVSAGRWIFSGTWTWGSGKPFTLPQYTFLIDDVVGAPHQLVFPGEVNNQRIPPYHRLDLEFTYKTHFSKVKVDMGASFYNVYNRQNINFKQISEDPNNEGGFVVNDVYQIGFIPSVFFRFKFR